MQIQINTDNHIHRRPELVEEVEATVEGTLGHFGDRLSRVEVHLADQNGEKGGDSDIRCMMEARIEGHQPVAVTHQSDSLDLAVDGAAEKLKAALEHTLGRLRDR
jgi:hypothetical protein